jgi:hypothetical protein
MVSNILAIYRLGLVNLSGIKKLSGCVVVLLKDSKVELELEREYVLNTA